MKDYVDNDCILDDGISLTEALENHKTFTFSSGASLYLTREEASDYCQARGVYIVSEY